jgi:hypothetical protein
MGNVCSSGDITSPHKFEWYKTKSFNDLKRDYHRNKHLSRRVKESLEKASEEDVSL